jgi:hypothetical protein
VIEPLVALADARRLLRIARGQRRVECRDPGLQRLPGPAPFGILGDARLQAALVGVGARIADVLEAIGLGKEQPEADAPRRVGGRRVEALGARNRAAQVGHILEGRRRRLRVRRRRLQDTEQRAVLLDQRLDRRIEIGRRHPELVRPPDARRDCVGEVLVGGHHLDPRQVQRLPRPLGQLLLGLDLPPPLGQDRLERAQGLVVGGDGRRLVFGEGGGLGSSGGHDADTAVAGCQQDRREDRDGNEAGTFAHELSRPLLAHSAHLRADEGKKTRHCRHPMPHRTIRPIAAQSARFVSIAMADAFDTLPPLPTEGWRAAFRWQIAFLASPAISRQS